MPLIDKIFLFIAFVIIIAITFFKATGIGMPKKTPMKKGDFHSPRSPHGEFSRNNPARRRDAIRRCKKEYEKTERAKRYRRNNYVAKSNFCLRLLFRSSLI